MAMGQNTYGQLGDGSTTDRSSPVQVVDSLGNPLSGVVGSSTGPNYTVYLKSDGTVWAVGMNSYGQLGDGTQTPRSNPEPVLDSSGNALSGVVGVSAGGEHTVFLKADGTVWATGYNAFGQLGDGTTTDRLYPVQVTYAGGFALTAADVADLASAQGPGNSHQDQDIYGDQFEENNNKAKVAQ